MFGAALVITDPGAKDRNNIPCAIVNENVIPMIVSLFNFALSVTGPKRNAVTIEKYFSSNSVGCHLSLEEFILFLRMRIKSLYRIYNYNAIETVPTQRKYPL